MVTTSIEWYRRYWLALPLLLAVLSLLLAMLLALLAACGQQVGNTPAHQRHCKRMHTMNPLKKLAAAASAAVAVTLTPAAHAQSPMDAGKLDGMKTAQATPASDLTEGEVRKIDLEAGKVTLKHGEIKNLDMPGMTMVFVVKDKALLDKRKAGDKVKFKAIKDAGKFTVTEIQPAR